MDLHLNRRMIFFFFNGVKIIQWEKWVFSTNGLEKLDIHVEKCLSPPPSYTEKLTQHGSLTDAKMKTVELLKENIGKNFYDLGDI